MSTNRSTRIILFGVVIGAIIFTACVPGNPDEPTGTTVLTQVPETRIEETEVPWPEPRIHPNMIYDPINERIYMFGGMSRMGSVLDLNEVWTYEAVTGSWEYLGEIEPRNTSTFAFGFDEESRQVVTLNNLPRETWAYNLESGVWEQRQPSEQPNEGQSRGRRFGAGIAYDSESDRLILFGGGAPEKTFSDTWAYDFNSDTWESMKPSNNPSPRAMYQMAYDSESDRVILWGGFTATDEDDVQIWAYDYNSDVWEVLENANGPQQHWERGGMVYIPELDRMLLFTGFRELEDVLVGPETWYYDYNTNTWTQLETETSPPPMTMYATVYDPSVEKVILFGGELTSKYAGDTTNDIWVFDPVQENWSQLTAPVSSQE